MMSNKSGRKRPYNSTSAVSFSEQQSKVEASGSDKTTTFSLEKMSPEMVKMHPSSFVCRSVNHYSTETALKDALEYSNPIFHPRQGLGLGQEQEQEQEQEQDHTNKTVNEIETHLPPVNSKEQDQEEQMPSIEETVSECSSRPDSPSNKSNNEKQIITQPSLPTQQSSVLTDSQERMPTITSTFTVASDWRLPNVDTSNSFEQTIEGEIKRLLVLKSYEALDLDSRERITYDRLAAMAARVFDVSVCVISLMDLGRLYFLGLSGFDREELPQIPRKLSFCAHCLLNKEEILQIFDTKEDERFRDNIFSTAFRFYAGTPLISPEGCRLGTFALLSSQPRPVGLTDSQKETLKDFANIAMDALVTRRTLSLQTKQVESSAQMLASAAHDLLTPLTGVQLSLSLLKQDTWTGSSEESESEDRRETPLHGKGCSCCTNISCEKCRNPLYAKNAGNWTTPRNSPTGTPTKQSYRDHRKECLATATTCAALMGEICETLRDRKFGPAGAIDPCGVTVTTNANSAFNDIPAVSSSSSSLAPVDDSNRGSMHHPGNKDENSSIACSSRLLSPISGSSMTKSLCHVPKLVERLKTVMEAVPKQVPLFVAVDPAVPSMILADELPIFRAALNLMSNSCDRAQSGCVRLAIRVTNETDPQFIGTKKELVFECTDSGPVTTNQDPEEDSDGSDGILLDDGIKMKTSQSVLLQSFGKSTLSSVSALVRSMGGDVGVKNLSNANKGGGLWKSPSCNFDSVTTATRIRSNPTTIFWFKIPLFVPGDWGLCDDSSEKERKNVKRPLESPVRNEKCAEKCNKVARLSGSAATQASHNDKPKKYALVIDDSIVVRKSLGRALSRLGYEAVLAEDGLVGLKNLKARVFDIVLCDFLMPVMDGMDCVREYRKWEKSFRTGFHQYIVGMSAHASSKDVERAIGIGMNKYISKPIFLGPLKNLTETAEKQAKSSQEVFSESIDKGPSKRVQPSLELSESNEKHICLIAGTSSENRRLEGIAKNNGYFPFLAENAEDVVRLMKARNWRAVFVDDALLQSNDGISCIQVFRQWEKQHRVHRQKNVFLMSSSRNSPQPGPASTLPPGIDDIIESPPAAESLSKILLRSKEEAPFAADDIVTSR